MVYTPMSFGSGAVSADAVDFILGLHFCSVQSGNRLTRTGGVASSLNFLNRAGTGMALACWNTMVQALWQVRVILRLSCARSTLARTHPTLRRLVRVAHLRTFALAGVHPQLRALDACAYAPHPPPPSARCPPRARSRSPTQLRALARARSHRVLTLSAHRDAHPRSFSSLRRPIPPRAVRLQRLRASSPSPTRPRFSSRTIKAARSSTRTLASRSRTSTSRTSAPSSSSRKCASSQRSRCFARPAPLRSRSSSSTSLRTRSSSRSSPCSLQR